MNHAVAETADAVARKAHRRPLALAVLLGTTLVLSGCGLAATPAPAASETPAAASSSAPASGEPADVSVSAAPTEPATSSSPSAAPSSRATPSNTGTATPSATATQSAAPSEPADSPLAFSAPRANDADTLAGGFKDGADYVRTYAQTELGAAAFVRDLFGPLDQHATFMIESVYAGDAAAALDGLNSTPEDFLATETSSLADEAGFEDHTQAIRFYQTVAPYVIEGASETLKADAAGLGSGTASTASIDTGRFFTYRDGTDASAEAIAPGTLVQLAYKDGWYFTGLAVPAG